MIGDTANIPAMINTNSNPVLMPSLCLRM